ncbi:MAG: FAD:protein FMN transferase [Blautia sp.]
MISLAGCAAVEETRPETRQQEELPADMEFFAMNTYMTFQAYGEQADSALEAAKKRVLELEQRWSVTEEDSEIYQINHSNGNAVILSEDTRAVMEFVLQMAEKTSGNLEPTIYPVLTAWGFTAEENRIPGEEEIQTLLKSVGYQKIQLNGNQIQIPSGMKLDLGAVGKGYAGDEAAETLKENGITSALLNLGGNVQAVGSKPDGSDWRIGIRNPFGEGNLGILEISDRAVVTSGNYEHYFVGEDGETYGHILNPFTGKPVENELMSMTIVTKQGQEGDALSTALFVMGLDGAKEYWREHPGFEMLAVTKDGEIYLTAGIQNQFVPDLSYEDREVYVIEP